MPGIYTSGQKSSITIGKFNYVVLVKNMADAIKTGVTLDSILNELRDKYYATFKGYGR